MTSPNTGLPADGAIKYALAQVGKPYVWGGTGPNGYDCSGLTMMAYKTIGVDIPRVAIMQMRTGKAVPDVANALPGDLIFPYLDGSHVTMYLGNNQQVEAPTAGQNVQVSKIYKTGGGIRRIVDGGGTAVSLGGGASPNAGSSMGTSIDILINVMNALGNPKTWASVGFIVAGVVGVGIAFVPMIKDKL